MFKTQVDVEEERGEIRRARTILRELIKTRFGTIPEPIAQRIDAADDPDKLTLAACQVYQVESLDKLPL